MVCELEVTHSLSCLEARSHDRIQPHRFPVTLRSGGLVVWGTRLVAVKMQLGGEGRTTEVHAEGPVAVKSA